MSQQPGADELRIRSILKHRGVGLGVEPPAMPTGLPDGFEARPEAWLDDILDGNAAPPAAEPEPEAAPQPVPAEPEPKPAKTKRPKKRRKKKQAHAALDWHDPRQSLLEAWDRTPPRLKWLIYHAAAAAAGWRIGIVTWSTGTAAWFAAGHWTTPSAFVLYGLGLCAVALYRRTRTWAWPVAWCAAIPVSSVVVGVLLYAPTQ